MKILIPLVFFFLSLQHGFAQENTIDNPTVNLRVSILLFPTTPLLTLEVRTIGKLTLQFESNFNTTHGINAKYFLRERMNESYLFMGIASVENSLLRTDLKPTFLPYVGYGYANRFGSKKQWTFDSRIGLGVTTNADSNGVYPVIKTGIGRIW